MKLKRQKPGAVRTAVRRRRPGVRPSHLQWPALVACLLWIASTLQAATMQSHESIREAARSYAEGQISPSDARVEIEVGKLDKRLRLHSCSEALESFSPPGRQGGSKLTVGVRCEGDKPWTIYVPVTLAQYRTILITTRDLARGSTIGQADIRLEERDVSRLRRGYFMQPSEVLGKKVKRTTRRNQILLPSQLTAATAVERGSMVTIMARTGGIQVRMKGKALSRGVVGERIQVQNLSSQRKVEATVIEPGVVEVIL
ncbi:MAG: flagellar basal body P-ring formation chaperone FlgA [Sedimenticola sp.]